MQKVFPPPPNGGHVFRQLKVLLTIFEKGSPKGQSCEIISKSDKRFQRRRILKNFSEVHTVKKAPLTAAMFFDGSKFLEQFSKRVTQGTIQWNSFKIGPVVSEKIFKEFLQKFHWLPWQLQFFKESNSVNNFKEDHLRNIPAKFGSNWPSSLGVADV